MKKHDDIINDYVNNKLSAVVLAKKYGYKTSKSIYDILKKNNIKTRDIQECKEIKKTYSSFDLSQIDSREKAYFIGLMLTDGYVGSQRNQIGIDSCDRDMIEFLSNYIGCSFIEINCSSHKTKYNFNQQNKFRLLLYSNKLIRQLKKYSIVSNKSLTLSGPRLTKEEESFLPFILRGIIDGDGWVRKDGKEFFICSASKDFIEWCKLKLGDLGMIKLKINFIDNEFNGIYSLRTARKENIEILKSKIYFEDNFGMQRKYLLLQQNLQRL